MTETPILMTPTNAQKCSDGIKTQTRRIIKDPDHYACLTGDCPHWDRKLCDEGMAVYSPYGKVGDRLWVQEAWAWPGEEAPLYKSDPAHARIVEEWKQDVNCCQVTWLTAELMPRWACRTVLEITDVRVERLQNITQLDALHEGCDGLDHRASFFHLWNSIHGEGAWDLNPWVWVISFQRVTS
jgi:hypothetical protein